MKKSFYILPLLMFFCQLTFAQNYQTFNSGRTVFFEDETSFVAAVRIDSVACDIDSTLYPFRIFFPDEESYNCWSPNIASWIGPKVIIKDNSENLFFNKHGDTITIQANAILGESWTFYQTEELIIIAEITEWKNKEFLEVEDSVKEFSFQAFDGDMDSIEHKVNDYQLFLSENYGLLSVFNFYFFPETVYIEEFVPASFYYNLIGITNPKIGFQNPTTYKVHNFQPEDELHILRSFDSFENSRVEKTIYKYLERTDFNDSIVYKIERHYSFKNIITDSTNFIHDTIYDIIKPCVLFDRLPIEPNREDIYEDGVLVVYNNEKIKKTSSCDYTPLWQIDDDCWELGHYDGGWGYSYFYKGLGGAYFYYESDHIMYWSTESKKLVYYKKGEETWGEPLVISNIANKKMSAKFSVYPNPAKNHIIINAETPQTLKVEIFELTGKLVSFGKIKTNEEFNISNLSRGIYLIKINDKDGNSFTNKLIKK